MLICRCLINPRPAFKDTLEKGEDILEEIKEERSRTSGRLPKRGSSSDEEELSEEELERIVKKEERQTKESNTRKYRTGPLFYRQSSTNARNGSTSHTC